MLKYFGSSLLITALVLASATFLGGWQVATIVLILGILEVSLSFDNAVINAKVIEGMDDIWRRRFITWGMAIAVFGMRLVFPLLIVGITASIAPWEAFHLAIASPAEYQHHLESAHVEIMGFGGSFLFMVFWKYFVDETKDVHWLRVIEQPLTKLGKIEAIQVALTMLAVYVTSKFLTDGEAYRFIIASIFGLITYILADGIGAFLEVEDATTTVAKSGLASFLYLELLDASFSFDGVVTSFLFTNNIFIILAGLGIGAFFVRSLTLMLVEKGVISKFQYLEHGAFWSVGLISMFMFIGSIIEIPEIFNGTVPVMVLLLSLFHSIISNRVVIEEDEVEIWNHSINRVE